MIRWALVLGRAYQDVPVMPGSMRWRARAKMAVSQANPVMMLARWNRPP